MYKKLFVAAGAVTVIVCAMGLLAAFVTVKSVILPDTRDNIDKMYLIAFFSMSAISSLLTVTLLICGVSFVLGRTGLSNTFITISLIELGYLLIVAAAWLLPTIGTAIATATGTANISIGFQMLILLPIWGPILVARIRNKLHAVA